MSTTNWHRTNEYIDLGLLPMILYDGLGPVSEQLNQRYAHGGGYMPFGAGYWELSNRRMCGRARLKYPGDPVYTELARARIGDELVILFEASMLAIVQKNDDFVVTRVD